MLTMFRNNISSTAPKFGCCVHVLDVKMQDNINQSKVQSGIDVRYKLHILPIDCNIFSYQYTH